jgi:cob(I)alamin adenosyltransferase
MSIATKRGDGGQTSLAGGIRVSEADLRVEAYGTVDELNSTLGFARSVCTNAEICSAVHDIQKALFRVGSALATPPESKKGTPPLSAEDVNRLTDLVHAIEAKKGILSDWSLPGAHTQSAVFDVARTVCRRAERCIVRLVESGVVIHPDALPYINRLSDLILLFARQIELKAEVDSHLRDEKKTGPRWSRAW